MGSCLACLGRPRKRGVSVPYCRRCACMRRPTGHRSHGEGTRAAELTRRQATAQRGAGRRVPRLVARSRSRSRDGLCVAGKQARKGPRRRSFLIYFPFCLSNTHRTNWMKLLFSDDGDGSRPPSRSRGPSYVPGAWATAREGSTTANVRRAPWTGRRVSQVIGGGG
jgi:hypothetical protein